VARLVVQLDSDNFTERVAAQAALEKLGERAAHLLKKALDGNPTLELRLRLLGLLDRIEQTSTVGLQYHRAVVTLEWIGSPTARDVLQRLKDGAPDARLTIEAREAVRRLKK
jgi:HEAT repeat protein